MNKVIPLSNPKINRNHATIHPFAAIKGNVYLGQGVTIAAAASIADNEAQPIWIGNDVCVKDGVVLQALGTNYYEELIGKAVVEVEGELFGVYVSDRVFLAPQSQVHGPAYVGADTFVGMQSLIFRATVGENCVIEPKALVMGVEIGDGRYVPAGAIITTQTEANRLPFINRRDRSKNFSRIAASVDRQLATGNLKRMQLQKTA